MNRNITWPGILQVNGISKPLYFLFILFICPEILSNWYLTSMASTYTFCNTIEREKNEHTAILFGVRRKQSGNRRGPQRLGERQGKVWLNSILAGFSEVVGSEEWAMESERHQWEALLFLWFLQFSELQQWEWAVLVFRNRFSEEYCTHKPTTFTALERLASEKRAKRSQTHSSTPNSIPRLLDLCRAVYLLPHFSQRRQGLSTSSSSKSGKSASILADILLHPETEYKLKASNSSSSTTRSTKVTSRFLNLLTTPAASRSPKMIRFEFR